MTTAERRPPSEALKVYAQYDRDFTEEADVAVVGSGPSGAVVAKELTDAGLRVVLLLFLMAVPSRGLNAQEPVSPASPTADTVAVAPNVQPVGADSIGVSPGVQAVAADSAPVSSSVQAIGADTAGVSLPVSPMGAFFRSLVLPGWGQVAVDQPGRGAFYFAAEAGSLWMLMKTNTKLKAAKNADPPDEDLVELREDQVEDWATLAVFWALFAGVDAWVSAQLWDFTGEVVPPPDGSPGAAFRSSIPVGP